MTKYVTLLRGINVDGKNKIKMADLKDAYAKEGFQTVRNAKTTLKLMDFRRMMGNEPKNIPIQRSNTAV